MFSLKRRLLFTLVVYFGMFGLFAAGYWLHKYVLYSGMAEKIDQVLGPQYLGILPFTLDWTTVAAMFIAFLITFALFFAIFSIKLPGPKTKEAAK